MKTLYALAILTTLGIGGVALAHGPGHGPGKLERLDANKDGKVTLAEMQSEAAQKFKELDADKNGRVVKEEMAAHHEQMRAKWAQRFADKKDAQSGDKAGKHGDCHGGKDKAAHFMEKADRNGDGAIDVKEHEANVAERFARMDQNGDKVLAGAELERGHGKRFKHGRGHGRGGQGNGPAQGAAGGAAPR
jgi:hypothetical protein